MELDFVAVVDITAEIARGCPSTAWNVGNLGCHHWILGYYEPETQHEVWDANPDALIASSIALAAGRGRKVDGGFIVSGPLAVLLRRRQLGLEHAGRHGLRRRRQNAGRLAPVPGAEVRLRDHRHLVRHGHGRHRQQGHRRRPSCSCRSAARWRCSAAAAAASIRARRSHRARSIGIPIVAASSHPIAPTAVGAAEGAYELFVPVDGQAGRALTRARRSRTSRPCRSRSPARAA